MRATAALTLVSVGLPIRTAPLELSLDGAEAEALVHALEHVLLARPAADPRRKMTLDETEEFLERPPPYQPRRALGSSERKAMVSSVTEPYTYMAACNLARNAPRASRNIR